MKVKLELEGSLEEALEILEFLMKKHPKKQLKATIIHKEIASWPYWCWNCKKKIEEKPEKMECPHCGVGIPES